MWVTLTVKALTPQMMRSRRGE